MTTADLQAPAFTDETVARAAMEAVLWPHGPVCPRCATLDKICSVSGKSHRPGLYYCGHCKRQFTVTVGTIFERSKVPLSKWWLAIHLIASSKKGVSSHQLYRMLGVTYQTAWFMSHRIREAMKDGGSLAPLGGQSRTIEADETYLGRKKGVAKPKGGPGAMRPIMALVERKSSVRSFHVEDVNSKTAKDILNANADPASALMTDECRHYRKVGKEFAEHERVHHARGEYVRGSAHTNTMEGYFELFKRGMKGIYQHCGEKHLHRYLAEFDFRYNNRIALGVDYKTAHHASSAEPKASA